MSNVFASALQVEANNATGRATLKRQDRAVAVDRVLCDLDAVSTIVHRDAGTIVVGNDVLTDRDIVGPTAKRDGIVLRVRTRNRAHRVSDDRIVADGNASGGTGQNDRLR
ncbi:hypothetical protein Pla22_28850 [Rubripirellula amarantea]|uniref:Uncharacterized protein n=1 Tax=Rubripirellula amarantea TaxID=2527999 RepID=A0A5C5WJ61_9BACT|nr:hypothetical protein Pla22_28850 [Rubripirellula amarantea]